MISMHGRAGLSEAFQNAHGIGSFSPAHALIGLRIGWFAHTFFLCPFFFINYSKAKRFHNVETMSYQRRYDVPLTLKSRCLLAGEIFVLEPNYL